MTARTDGDQHNQPSSNEAQHKRRERRMYLTFGAMILTSTVTMFLLTYTNAFAWDHVRWSEERVYMALLMGSVWRSSCSASCGE